MPVLQEQKIGHIISNNILLLAPVTVSSACLTPWGAWQSNKETAIGAIFPWRSATGVRARVVRQLKIQ